MRGTYQTEDIPLIVALEEAKRRLIEIEDTVKDLRHAIRYEDLMQKTEELEARTMADNFWNNADESSKILQSIKQMKDKYKKSGNVILKETGADFKFTKAVEY